MNHILPCLDSADHAAARRRELHIVRSLAIELGRSAVDAARAGVYPNAAGHQVEWGAAVQAACAAKLSIALETEFCGAFTEIVFAITDWSPERKFLGPFREAFAD